MGNSLEALRKELKRWPTVDYTVDMSGRHPRVIVGCGGVERFVPFSSTKVGRYGLMQKVTQLRRMLRDMGASND